jgi:hypothetical protein
MGVVSFCSALLLMLFTWMAAGANSMFALAAVENANTIKVRTVCSCSNSRPPWHLISSLDFVLCYFS